MTESDIHKKAMLKALEKSLGVVTTACKFVDISRETHYRWMREDQEYKDAVEGVAEIAIDFAESKLHDSIENGSDTAIIFYLKTKGKKRGYIERQEFQHEGNLSLPVIFQLDERFKEDSKDNTGIPT